MKVSEFLEKFSKEDLDKELYMASDAEGNSFHDINEVCITDEGELIIFPSHEVVEIEENTEEPVDPFQPVESDDEDIYPAPSPFDQEEPDEEENAPHNQDPGQGK